MSNGRYMYIVVEDILSEVALRKIIYPKFSVAACYGKKGNGYIKKGLKGFNDASKHSMWLVLTDLDNELCPLKLISKWLASINKNPNLIFRIAVKEIETWLLADKINFARYLSVSNAQIPENVESIQNPKEFIVELAKKSRKRSIREDIVPIGSFTKIGRNYNNCLIDFVGNSWDLDAARIRSRSLDKLVRNIETL